MTIVVGLDPGLRHMGWSVFDTEKKEFISFGCYDMMKGQPKTMKTKYEELVYSFCQNSQSVLETADIICIERQMVAKFKVIACSLRCFNWEKAVMVSPRSMRVHFKISTGKYSTNKKASIDIIPKLKISDKNKDWFRLLAKSKKDDIADAMLLALYWVEAKLNPKPKKRKRSTSSTRRKKKAKKDDK